MNKYKFYAIIIVQLFISGCGATGEIYKGLEPLKENNAQIYIYRPSKFYQGLAWPTVFIDGQDRFTLKNGGYVNTLLTPGDHTLKLGAANFFSNWSVGDIKVDLTLEPNQRYFYKLDLEFGSIAIVGSYTSVSGAVRLIEVSKENALKELKELNSSM